MFTVWIAGCVVVLACGSMLAWTSGQMRREFQTRLGTLSAAVRILEQDAAERAAAADTPAPADIPRMARMIAAGQDPTAIPPETQAVIKATLSALLGHKVRIRSVKLLEKADAATTWAAQGRIAVHTSHNQRMNRS
jgi:hypothetical protein